ncbi:MAG: hypothetical protein IJQ71_11040 [Clostridia bacterium]|nr:hypothetical protein [Clostridia bacterium]
MADQEFLASFGVEIDESGVARLQAALEENRTLAEKLAAAFDRARESVRAFFRDLNEISLPGLNSGKASVTEEPAGMNIPISLDFTKANKELAAFLKEATKAFKLTADGSAVVSAGRNALSSLQSMFASTVLPLKVQIETSGGTGNAAGAVGSAASAATASVAQTGAKAAVSSLESLLNVSSVNAPVTNNSSKTIQAPISINVTAAGSNPEAVGRSVYNVAEQYLLRTLGGE